MQVREHRHVHAQQVSRWWSQTRQYTNLSHRLTQAHAKDLNRVSDYDGCIHALNAQFKAIETIPYPKSATRIRQALLAFILNTLTALQHARRNVIFDIAMVDKNMVELYLDEYSLSL